MIFLFYIGILLVTLLSMTASLLTLSSIGHLHLKAQALQAQVASVFHEVQFQNRCTRKALLDVLNEKVLPSVGYREPEPSEFERAVQALSEGREPVIDFSGIKLKGKPE